MFKRTIVILSTLIFFILIFTGCQKNTNIKNQEEEKFQAYYNSRIQYIGENSKVAELLDIIGVGSLGEYNIALKTDSEPYGLTINYTNLKNEGDEAKFKNLERIEYAYFALALIENLNVIDINYKGYNFHLTTDEANKFIQGDIKDYGKTTESLMELNKILNPAD